MKKQVEGCTPHTTCVTATVQSLVKSCHRYRLIANVRRRLVEWVCTCYAVKYSESEWQEMMEEMERG